MGCREISWSLRKVCSERHFGGLHKGGSGSLPKRTKKDWMELFLPSSSVAEAYHGDFRDGITLSTLPSMQIAFPFRERLVDYRKIRKYRYVIVEVVSQMPDCELFPTLICIRYSTFSCIKYWPNIVFRNDSYQLPPNTTYK